MLLNLASVAEALGLIIVLGFEGVPGDLKESDFPGGAGVEVPMGVVLPPEADWTPDPSPPRLKRDSSRRTQLNIKRQHPP